MFTRIPAYRETLDRIEGVVHVKDVLRAAAAGERPSAGDLLRPVLVVPETKPLRELLREFQSSRQQLAVVLDEYGGTSGIVTLEDVLEEIVGEIQDEHQREGPEYTREAPGVFIVDGSAHFEVLEEIFDVEVGDVAFDSVAGLVLDQLGHLPRLGEKASWQGLVFEVVEVDRRRLRRVRVSGPEKVG
jgi:CBS domain containing-hemolysin-like protein